MSEDEPTYTKEAEVEAVEELDREEPDLPAYPAAEFVTGPAGCGKTFMMKDRISKSPEGRIALAATTGVAAINLGEGTTINSLIGYFDTASLRDMWTQGWLTMKLAKLYRSGLRYIVLDEVSMLDGEQLAIFTAAIDELNDRLAASYEGPMGLTLTGDFCFGKGTRVLLADGSVCLVEALCVGDRVMGPDFRPRTVLRLTSGVDDLYEVKQTNGEAYTVNSAHLLVLKRGKNGSRREWDGHGHRYPTGGHHMLLSAPQLAAKSDKFREVFVGYRAGAIPLPPREFPLDPYFLGLWLGDGESDAPRICSADPEIIDYCQEYAERHGLRLGKRRERPGSRAFRLSLTSGRRHGSNPIWAALKALGVVGNKHLPEAYLLNTEIVRLALLAGLLDTDGCWSGNRYAISQARERLARQIKQLADGLGFRTGIRRATTRLRGKLFPSWCVTIGGDTWRIPCRVKRKRSEFRDLRRDRLSSVLTIKAVGQGDYYGFEIDGEHTFLLADGTVAHNCQLPPVKAKYAFELEDSWKRFGDQTTRLTEIKRQADKDFILALQAARRGDTKGALEFFGPILQDAIDHDYDGPTLLAKNDAVDRFNGLRLTKLQGARLQWGTARWGKPRGEWRLVPEQLNLKVGALVMVLANKKRAPAWEGEDPGYLYVNGDLGEVVGKDPDVEEHDGAAQVRLRRTGQVVQVGKVTRENTVPIEPGRKKELKEKFGLDKYRQYVSDDGKREVVGGLEYTPLRLAYATTVHKSQGLSLDNVQVDFRDKFFESPHMLYVALSRARTKEGLRLVGRAETFKLRLKIDEKVREWL